MSGTFDHKKNRQALASELLEVFTDESRVAWENRPFTPPSLETPTVWIKEHYVPNTESQVATGTIRALGMTRYDVMYPVGQGTETPEGVAFDIAERFRAPKDIVFNGHEVEVYRTERLPSLGGQRLEGTDAVWVAFPVKLEWRSYVFFTL